MKTIVWGLLGTGILAICVVTAGQFGLLSGVAPDDLGVRSGRLKPPSSSANSVSSQAALYPDHPQLATSGIAPLTFSGPSDAAKTRLASVLHGMPNTVIVAQSGDYLYAQSTTRILKFTDDLEFWFDTTAGVIHVRSASRLGSADFGVNRARIETLRARFGN